MIASRINSRLSAAERHGTWLMAISNWPPPDSQCICSIPISKASNTLLISDMMDAEASKPADEQYGVVSTPSHLFGLPSTEESVYDTCRMNLTGEKTKMVCIQSTIEHPCFPLLSDLRYDI
jgi:hypothetical protein